MAKRQATTDRELLCAYVNARSQEAFCRLVERHAGMVYTSALRRVRREALAEDVAQAVFIVLARKAPSLVHVRTLGGWLLKVTRFAAIDAVRKEKSDLRLERQVASWRREAYGSESGHPSEKSVEDALERLTRMDRETLILRFYQDASFAEMGVALGVSPEAARKRTTRALERLRSLMNKRGQDAQAALLMTWLGATRRAPGHLVMSISQRAGASPTGMTLVKGTMKTMAIKTMKLYLAGAATCAGSLLAGWFVMAAMQASSKPPVLVEAAPMARVPELTVEPPAQDMSGPATHSRIEVKGEMRLTLAAPAGGIMPALSGGHPIFTLAAAPGDGYNYDAPPFGQNLAEHGYAVPITMYQMHAVVPYELQNDSETFHSNGRLEVLHLVVAPAP